MFSVLKRNVFLIFIVFGLFPIQSYSGFFTEANIKVAEKEFIEILDGILDKVDDDTKKEIKEKLQGNVYNRVRNRMINKANDIDDLVNVIWKELEKFKAGKHVNGLALFNHDSKYSLSQFDSIAKLVLETGEKLEGVDDTQSQHLQELGELLREFFIGVNDQFVQSSKALANATVSENYLNKLGKGVLVDTSIGTNSVTTLISLIIAVLVASGVISAAPQVAVIVACIALFAVSILVIRIWIAKREQQEHKKVVNSLNSIQGISLSIIAVMKYSLYEVEKGLRVTKHAAKKQKVLAIAASGIRILNQKKQGKPVISNPVVNPTTPIKKPNSHTAEEKIIDQTTLNKRTINKKKRQRKTTT